MSSVLSIRVFLACMTAGVAALRRTPTLGVALGCSLLAPSAPAAQSPASPSAAQTAAAQGPIAPETLRVTSDSLRLRALLWRPRGRGPFAAVLFNHGSHTSAEQIAADAPATLGSLFARHGYVFLFLFRQGTGLSAGQGTLDGDLMAQAQASQGPDGRNRVQLELLEGAEMHEALAALVMLRSRPDVDPGRIAVVGHSFGGSLTLVLAAHDTGVRAAVVFGAAAASWDRSPPLRSRLLQAVDQTTAPVLFIHACNDYTTASGQQLSDEMQRRGKPHALKIYPPTGSTPAEGHDLIYSSVTRWEKDVFEFLEARLAQRTPR